MLPPVTVVVDTPRIQLRNTIDGSYELTDFEQFIDKVKQTVELVYVNKPFTNWVTYNTEEFIRSVIDGCKMPWLIHKDPTTIIDVTGRLYSISFSMVGDSLSIGIRFVID